MKDSFSCRQTFQVDGDSYQIYSLEAFSKKHGDLSKLPFSIKVMLENLLRNEDGRFVTPDHIRTLAKSRKSHRGDEEISFSPARVLMQDFTGVPAIVDLAAMRDAMNKLGGNPTK